MSTLKFREKIVLEDLLGMSSGYVLNFSDRTFGEFFDDLMGIDIHSDRYSAQGGSKANKLRLFWKVESDYRVGKLLLELAEYCRLQPASSDLEYSQMIDECCTIAHRLLSSSLSSATLTENAARMNANHLKQQIQRMEQSIDSDPSLAIGTAKELIETCCKTILNERNVQLPDKQPDIPSLTKAVFKELELVPEGVPNEARGRNVHRRILSNLATIGNGIAELRGLYGTGHGQDGRVSGLTPRHARLAVGSAATLATFLFETHMERPK